VTQNRKIGYDYVITSPPDMEEIGLQPTEVIKYKEFLALRISKLKPTKDIITIFVSNRKGGGKLIEKDRMIVDIMESNGWSLQSKKIWIKTYKINLYRPGYTNILTFRKNKVKVPNLPDCFYEEFKSASKEYTYNFSFDIVSQFIEKLTDKGDVVYDPFIGSGTTLNVCNKLKRECMGSEIDTETFDKFLK